MTDLTPTRGVVWLFPSLLGVVPLYPFALLDLESVFPLLSYLLNSIKYALKDITGALPLSSFFLPLFLAD